MRYLRSCKCGTKAYDEEDLELFVNVPEARYGRSNKCKKCHNLYARSRSGMNKKSVKRATAKKAYGITLEEYTKCMNTSNCCEICNTEENLCYDHDHTTMKFRGVLCSKCNRHLGGLGDSIEGLTRALKYLVRKSKIRE